MGAESGRFDAYALTKERSVNREEVMAKPSGLQKALSVVDQGKRKKLISFATIYNNDIRFPAHYDLERAFGKTITAIQQQASRYRSFRNLHPDWHLPFLVGRQVARGGLLEVPESVMKQLDQFRYETAEFVRDAKKAGGFLVTSAQFGAPLNPWVWKAFQQYSKVTGFPIAVLPIKYGPLQTWHQEENGEVKVKLASSFPDELKGHVLLEDALLCGGELQLNTVRMRPTLIRFLTDDICELGGEASQIMAAPVVELERRPQVRRRLAKVIMTTGAVTYPNYKRDKLGQQDRTGEIAEHNHVFAAVVVELKGDTFHFRQLVSSKRGTFYDIDPQRGGATLYTPESSEHRPNDVAALYCGDWHTGVTDEVVRQGTFGDCGMVERLQPKDVVVGDLFDGRSCNFYQIKQAMRRAYMAPLQDENLQAELEMVAAEVRWIHKQTTSLVPSAKVHAIASNHPEFVTEYINSTRFMRDDENIEIGMRMFLMGLDDIRKRKPARHMIIPTDPLILWFREHCPEVHMVERQDVLLLPRGVKHSVLCSLHGDQGIRGGDTRSTRAFKKWNRRVILGHNHSGLILGPVWRVGTSTPLIQFYIQNPKTDWSNTHCVIFASGQRQLINFVKGEWHGQKVTNLKTRKKRKS